jgi:AcrR family transcriptional regulator
VSLGTIRYHFGTREQLLVHAARYKDLAQLERCPPRAARHGEPGAAADALLGLVEDLDHYRVTFGLLRGEARQMPDLRLNHQALSGEHSFPTPLPLLRSKQHRSRRRCCS